VSEMNRSATAPTTAGQREYLDAMISRVSGAFPGPLCARYYNPTGQTRIRTAGRARTPFGH
jgi:hypothetical protein